MASRTRSRATSLIALLAVFFLLATACSDDTSGSTDEASTSTTAAADGATTTTAAGDVEPPSESAAASLRSDLVGLLEEQVYLTGYVVDEALAGPDGLDSPVASAAVTSAGESATELSDIVGSGYGVAAGTDFLAAWNDHREAIVAYGVEDGPVDDIATTRDAVVDTLVGMDEEADFTGVAEGLEASDTALITTVDDMVAGQAGAAAELRTAADPMGDIALDLATAISGRIVVEGELDSPEAALRADLTGLVQESALLTSLGLTEIVQAGGDASAAAAADVFTAVQDNTDALADVIEPDDVGSAAEFTALWNGHIDDFVAYTVALIDDDAQGIQDAEDSLVQFRDDLGELLAGNYPAFTKEQVAEELVDHTDSILAFVDASVREAGDLADDVEETSQLDDAPSEAPGLMREAALAARLLARTFTRGITAPASDEAAGE